MNLAEFISKDSAIALRKDSPNKKMKRSSSMNIVIPTVDASVFINFHEEHAGFGFPTGFCCLNPKIFQLHPMFGGSQTRIQYQPPRQGRSTRPGKLT